MTGLGLYAQAREFLAVSELEPRYQADPETLPALRMDDWGMWARPDQGAFSDRIQIAHDRTSRTEVVRVKPGAVRWASRETQP